MGKQKMILLSDLWGNTNANWLTHYTAPLEKHFDIICYDSCALGQVDRSACNAAALHTQFVAGGIARAVESLLQKEQECFALLGFSIGGLIAWKACLAGLKAQHLVAVSSTRLRLETLKPAQTIHLFYGENDAFQPETAWFKEMSLNPYFYKQEAHEFYKKEEIAQDICRRIIQQRQTG